MRIKVVGENDCARALRGLLRQAGFAVSEFLPTDPPRRVNAPSAGYVISVVESEGGENILFDSVDCPLEANILRHVTALSKLPVLLDRPGGEVHSDREIRISVPACGGEAQQLAVEFGVLRGLMDTVAVPTAVLGEAPSLRLEPPRLRRPQQAGWWKRIFSLVVLVALAGIGVPAEGGPGPPEA